MCGLVGFNHHPKGVAFIEQGIDLLKYRGYDSFGYAVQKENWDVILQKSLTKLDFGPAYKYPVSFGIGHARWASHGKVNTLNAHPIPSSDEIWYVVHNGIIENYKELNKRFGFKAKTETDTETIANLLERFILPQFLFGETSGAIEKIYNLLEGSFAFIAFSKYGMNVFAKRNMPLYQYNNLLGSDPIVFNGFSDKCFALENGYGYLEGERGFFSNDKRKQIVVPAINNSSEDGCIMENEIKEQAKLVHKQGKVDYTFIKERWREVHPYNKPDKIILFGCGSSYNAALLGKQYFERLAGMPSEVYYSTELIDEILFDDVRMYIGISQSGETKDTLAVFDKILERKLLEEVIGITNSNYNGLAQRTINIVEMEAGKELAVAATKTFTMTVLKLFYVAKSMLFPPKKENFQGVFDDVIENYWKEIKDFAILNNHFSHILVLANGMNYPIAREIALKVKEVAYIHSEAIYSSEIKHGPLALIDDNVLSIFLVSKNDNLHSVLQNINEVKARNGKVIVVSDDKSVNDINCSCDIILPNLECNFLQPLVYNLFGQIFALELALSKGLNPDMPRNLAKSVTV